MAEGILPKKNYWSTFRRCMRRAFSPQTPSNTPDHYGLELKTRLGKWSNVQRNTWFDCYRGKDSLYLQQEAGHLQALKLKGTPGFYSTGKTIHQLLLDSHPISHKIIGKDMWKRAPHKANTDTPTRRKPPGLICEDTLGRRAW